MSWILGNPGNRVLLLGNEAIARGAIEAGVNFVIGYPGTPSSEILAALARVADKLGIYVNWAINEKVALETAVGASLSGLRSLVTMKHVGVNVAADPLMTLAYIGVIGGFVLISADDPQCHTSQTEQDNRYYAMLAKIPVLEPTNPQEAKDMTRIAFSISEEHQIPVMLRSTPRLSHTFGEVVLGEITKSSRKPSFPRDPDRWVCVGPTALRRHKILEEKQNKIKEVIDNLDFNKLILNNAVDIGIITVGVAYNYVLYAIDKLNIGDKVNVLKICSSNPLPEKNVLSFLKRNRKILIVEELDPIVEKQVLALAKKFNIDTEIYGKLDGFLPLVGELNPDTVAIAIAKFMNIPYEVTEKLSTTDFSVPQRGLAFCAGCPHRATYYSLRKVLREIKKSYIVTGDIGCYTIGKASPFNILDTCICMGASISMASGFELSKASDVVIAVIGDSTFLHNGIPPLINAVYNNSKIKVLILDNETTAMTGHQPHPGTGYTATGAKSKKVLIEDLAKACGVEFVKIVDPYNLKETQKVLREAIEFNGPAVVILRRTCALLYSRMARAKGIKLKKYAVVQDKCRGCLLCIRDFGCPAMIYDSSTKKVHIDPFLCTGCGVCVDICPFNAIEEVGQ
ncbi:MAG: indolepyruvate ferredoxin oxidoreductase subunit alpha [Thermoprotei archaeon]|nr:MAG: indolepyruvate ferredoxin oxidoreductase subunit alpha [Thermoprotei archaeon]